MTIHMAYVPPDAETTTPERIDLVLVKEGFSWPALIVAPLWLIWHRMWWVLLGYVVAVVLIGVLGQGLGEDARTMLEIVFAIGFALEANDLRAWSLERKGWRLAGLIEGRDLDTVERRFFEAWLQRPAKTAPASRTDRPPVGPRAVDTGIIGLFPGNPSPNLPSRS
ncbi:hypothetical protein HDIA_0171 [Hartmannibacter diazotrophicus]|uniref:DUF2628 domain-containing protein n=1 Tax=Hartmannibacter diazotrophicus TaxID=1482074 RepID=A0A2C9D058_9HYPH|nr:DUF2628 domain-containing protein [Hartmannibacter diazotrophicus]SON53712.1 hypothetical protein HDIA_0171 [Hartmannibacter diazotrophicus]